MSKHIASKKTASKNSGRHILETNQGAARKKSVIMAAAMTATAALGSGFALTAPLEASAANVPASFASKQSLATNASNAKLSATGLDSVLNTRLAPLRAAFGQQGATAASQTKAMLTSGSGDYSVSGNTLTFTSPAAAQVGGSAASQLDPINTQLLDLSGPNGQLAKSMSRSVTAISPALDPAGHPGAVTANVPVDLTSAVAPLLTGTQGTGATSFDPNTGVVSVDLSKLNLTNAADGTTGSESAGTQVTSAIVSTAIANSVESAISGLGDRVAAATKNAIVSAPVSGSANVNTVSAQVPVVGSVCSTPGTGSSGLLGGALGGTVSGLSCAIPSSLLPQVASQLTVAVNGTIGQLIEGTAAAPTGSMTLLGVPTALNTDGITNGIVNQLVSNLTGPRTSGATGTTASTSTHTGRHSATTTGTVSTTGTDTSGSTSIGTSVGGITAQNLLSDLQVTTPSTASLISDLIDPTLVVPTVAAEPITIGVSADPATTGTSITADSSDTGSTDTSGSDGSDTTVTSNGLPVAASTDSTTPTTGTATTVPDLLRDVQVSTTPEVTGAGPTSVGFGL